MAAPTPTIPHVRPSGLAPGPGSAAAFPTPGPFPQSLPDPRPSTRAAVSSRLSPPSVAPSRPRAPAHPGPWPRARAPGGPVRHTTPPAPPGPPPSTLPHVRRSGLALGLGSAAAFATSGPFAKSLLDTGWSPGAAVTSRISLAAVVLAVPGALAMRGRWHLVRPKVGTIVLYGLLAIAGCQLFYFNAVQTLSVGVALLLEYLGLILVVLWLWLRSEE